MPLLFQYNARQHVQSCQRHGSCILSHVVLITLCNCRLAKLATLPGTGGGLGGAIVVGLVRILIPEHEVSRLVTGAKCNLRAVSDQALAVALYNSVRMR